MATAFIETRSGAAWCSGAGERYTLPSSRANCIRAAGLQGVAVRCRDVDERRLDALRPAGRAGAVEHVGAAPFRSGRLGRLVGDDVVQGAVAARGVVEGQAHLDPWGRGHQLLGDAGGRRGDDHDARPAVVDHVGRLVGGRVGVDGGDVQAAVDRREDRLQIAQVVVGEHGEVVAGLQPRRTQEVGQLRRPPVQLAEGDPVARRPHHDRRPIGCPSRLISEVHGRLPPSHVAFGGAVWHSGRSLPWVANVAHSTPKGGDRAMGETFHAHGPTSFVERRTLTDPDGY